MKVRKKKLEPYFGDVMDVYYILEGLGHRVLLWQIRGQEPVRDGTFKIETDSKGEKILVLPPTPKGVRRVRVVYNALTVYQLDIPNGATKVPMRVDRR